MRSPDSCAAPRTSPQVVISDAADNRALSVGRLPTCPAAGATKTAHQRRRRLSAGFRSDVPQPPDAAERGGTIGASGTACELPVAFDIAKYWKAEAVDARAVSDKASDKTSGSGTAEPEDEPGDDVAGSLLRQGPVTAACEVDAKPAGDIGYLRVWTGEPGDDDARTVLEAFVADEDGASKVTYRTFTAVDLAGVEAAYQYTSEILDETKQEHAPAVTTVRGPVVLHLGGLDDEEHRAMLPAFELAKRTLHST